MSCMWVLTVGISNLMIKEIHSLIILEIWQLVNFIELVFQNRPLIKLQVELKIMVDLHILMTGIFIMEEMEWKV